MECISSERMDALKFLRAFNIKTTERRIPLSGSLDLTHQCNLNCIHCYLGERRHCQDQTVEEMNTDRILSVIDEIADAGCLYLLITGGEPLLRNDFPRIYTYAKEKGIIVTVFTNGTLITDAVIKLFRELPPLTVEISLYGSTPSTYEKITRVEGSYEKCISGIKRLAENRIPFRLKTILMTVNNHEFFSMQEAAKDLNVKFRFDGAIFPRLNGDKAPLNLRVAPEDAVEKEFSDNDRYLKWERYLQRSNGRHLSDRLYHCGAGVTGFHIDPYGNLQPCLMVTHIRQYIFDNGFLAGWHKIVSDINGIKAGNAQQCNHCEKRQVCDFCPGFFKIEKGAEDVRSEYVCELAENRFSKINDNIISRG